MNLRKKLKKNLDEHYAFKRYMSIGEIKKKLSSKSGYEEKLVATLFCGCVKINAVIIFVNKKPQVVLDFLVKEKLESESWICFDSLNDSIRLTSHYLENDLFSVMNREVKENNLSYLECSFEQIEGKLIGKF